jgi:hypothetical protein
VNPDWYWAENPTARREPHRDQYGGLIATGFAADRFPAARPFLVPFAIIQAFFVVLS